MRIRRISVFVITLLLAYGLHAQTPTSQSSRLGDDPRVTSVSGESWLTHINRSFGNTSMGKTGHLGPGVQEAGSLKPVSEPQFSSLREAVTLHGADLYRLNCQGCHGESGLGAPPEINSVINPVRATSVPLVVARMKATGMDMSYADAAKMARQANVALLDRLHKGGDSMPAFPQLHDEEISALLVYLRHLADVPGAGNGQSAVKESHVRVGELIVKSTCHTCHSATGPDPGPQELSNGAMPPLSSLTARKNEVEFIRKVTQGAPVVMGTPAMPCRGRMPVFFYLSEEEAADVYLYLKLYPPTERTKANPLVAASFDVKPPASNGPGSSPRAPAATNNGGKNTDSTNNAGFERLGLPLLAALLTFVLAGGLIFTLREFKRLSTENTGHAVTVRPLGVQPGSSGRMETIDETAGSLVYSDAEQSSQQRSA